MEPQRGKGSRETQDDILESYPNMATSVLPAFPWPGRGPRGGCLTGHPQFCGSQFPAAENKDA